MFDSLRKIVEEGALLLELKALRTEVRDLSSGVARIAAALEAHMAHLAPAPPAAASPDSPAFSVSYVNDEEAAAMMDVELRLTAATGQPPTEDEVLAEWDRRYPELRSAGARR